MRGLVVPVDVKTRVIVDHHPVARITQFPRDVRVAKVFRHVDVDDLRDLGVARLVVVEIPDGIDQLVPRARLIPRIGEH